MSVLGMPSVAGLVCVVLAVLVYLIIDLSPLVPGSVLSLFRNLGFWILYFILCVLTFLAYGVLKTTAGAKIANAFGPEFATLATIVLAVLSSLTVVQSFSLKIADAKILDVQEILQKFRIRVLANISKDNARMEARKRMLLADKLYARFNDDVKSLRQEYATVLEQSGISPSEIAKSLVDCEHEATGADLSFARQLAQKITNVNPDRAQDLVGPSNRRIAFWRK